jgi:drug/metabolite transporter (DMT)-like permease
MLITLKLFLASIFWGGTFVAARIVARDVPPYSASFLRFLIACLFLIVLLLLREGRLALLTRRQGALAVLLGITGVFAYNAFFFLGLKTVAAGRASLIVATNPIFISLFSALLFGERLTAGKIAGIVLCLTGATVVISRGDLRLLFTGGLGWGEVFICGCVASWVAYSLIGKLILKDCPPLNAVTWSCLFGTAALLPFACQEGMLVNLGSIAVRDWGGLFYLGFFGTVLGFIWYYEGIRRIGAGRASIFINFVPVSGVFLGWLLLDEAINLSLLAGAALVIGGVFLTHRPVALPRSPGDSESHP